MNELRGFYKLRSIMKIRKSYVFSKQSQLLRGLANSIMQRRPRSPVLKNGEVVLY